MEHFNVQVIQQEEESERGIKLIRGPTFVAHGFLSRQSLVDLQQGVTLARDSTHWGKRWPHNGGNGVLIG